MSERPILMNTDMVRAILEGQKTVTRRVVKLKYGNTHLKMQTDKYGTRLVEVQNEEPGVTTVENPDGTTTHRLLACIEKEPPYKPGDILWVRETWAQPATHIFWYKADIPEKNILWRPSIHMPREAARIFLRVTDVWVERLQCLSLEQAHMEGQPRCNGGLAVCGGPQSCQDCEADTKNAVRWFSGIWDSTIKPADRATFGWDANPWVWVISFERISKDEAPLV